MPDYDNTFILWKARKSENPKAPSFSGFLTVGGHKYRIAAWTKSPDKNGDKYLTGKVTDDADAQAKPQAQKPQAAQDALDDDSIPF